MTLALLCDGDHWRDSLAWIWDQCTPVAPVLTFDHAGGENKGMRVKGKVQIFFLVFVQHSQAHMYFH